MTALGSVAKNGADTTLSGPRKSQKVPGLAVYGVAGILATKVNTLESRQLDAIFLPVRVVDEEQPFRLEMFETISHRLRSPRRQKRLLVRPPTSDETRQQQGTERHARREGE